MHVLTEAEFRYPHLYHYTSQNGLLGIVDKKQIWATNILYLNDTSEFSHALDLMEYGLEVIYESSPSRQEILFLEEMKKRLPEPDGTTMGIYVCSFSTMSDRLSQWRGYCPGGNGFSLRFDFNSILYDRIKEQGFNLVECIYANTLEFPEILQKFLSDALEIFNSTPSQGRVANRIEKALQSFKFKEKFLQLATQLKHSAFFEEEEWRLVSEPISLESSRIRFRNGKSMLIPYVEIKIEDKDGYINIPEVWIGPTPHPTLSEQSVENFLVTKGVYGFNRQMPPTPFDEKGKENDEQKVAPLVRVSEAPYHTW